MTSARKPLVLRALVRMGLLGFALAHGAVACMDHTEPPTRRRGAVAPEDAPTRQITIRSRTPDIPTFPCGLKCHSARKPNPTPRVLTQFHTNRTVHHGPQDRWCSFCHAISDVDYLRLFDGTRISFDEAYLLCGQCHGDRLRDFENGTHGLSGGGWYGEVERRSCTACHDPHAPTPFHFEALPAPTRTREGGP